MNTLKDEVDNKKDKSKGVSKLRQWISELYKDRTTADFILKRMEQTEAYREKNSLYSRLKLANSLETINYTQEQVDKNKETGKKPLPELKTIIYDVIQLHSLKY